ncbi:MAG: PAS domain S-box protein [Chloroflexota bacterium]
MNSLILSLFFVLAVAILLTSLMPSIRTPSLSIVIGYTLVLVVISKLRLNRGHLNGVKLLLTAILWFNSTLLVLFAGGLSNVTTIYYVLTTVFTTLLFGRRGALTVFAVTALVTLAMAVAVSWGWTPESVFLVSPLNSWLILVFGLVLILITLSMAIESRNRVLVALSESEEKYRALFDAGSDALLLVSQADGEIVDINQAALKLYGYDRSEMLGKALSEIFAEPQEAYQALQDLQSHIPLRYHRHKDGSVFPAEINIGTFSLNGKTMCIGAVRDIRMRLEAKQRERSISQGLAGIIAAADELMRCDSLDKVYKRAVEQGREKLGLERCALYLYDARTQRMQGTYGTDSQGNIVDESAASWTSDFSREMETSVKKTWMFNEGEYKTLQGDQYRTFGRGWVAETVLRLGRESLGLFVNDTALSHKPVDYLQQEMVAIYASLLENMIRQKRTEAALRDATVNLMASEERYRQAIEAAGAVPYVQDYTTHTFIFMGENIFQLTGYSAEEMTPALWNTLVEEALPGSETGRANEDTLARPDSPDTLWHKQCDYHIHTRFGELRWVMNSAIEIFDEQGLARGSIGILQDVTERKNVEAEREKLIEELEAKNAELERFTYTVSHDLKAPLITIQGFLGYLEKDAIQGNMERLHSDMLRITEATVRMQQLLNDLLELSRIGRMANPPEHVPFDLIVKDALALVQGRLARAHVETRVREPLPRVYGDAARLVEVVQNLIDNAAKFMEEQHSPFIEVGWQGMDEHGYHTFYVRDNGIGIPVQYHERVFGLFNKLDPKSEGTGVGLALVKRIIEVHGGKIWIESDGLKTGSTFYFTLPGNP